MAHFDFDVECVTVKVLHEGMHLRGLDTPPMFSVFKNGLRQAAILCRNLKAPVDQDKEEAYKEMFSIIATSEADTAFFACDAWFAPGSAAVDSDGNLDFSQVTRPSEHPNRIETFTCVTMQRGEEKVLQKNMPYIKDRSGNVYYVLSDQIGGTDHLVEGLIVDLLKIAFSISKEDSPFKSTQEHATALKEMGHHVAVWTGGESRGQMRLY